MDSLTPPLQLTGHLGEDTWVPSQPECPGQEARLKGEAGTQNSWRPTRELGAGGGLRSLLRHWHRACERWVRQGRRAPVWGWGPNQNSPWARELEEQVLTGVGGTNALIQVSSRRMWNLQSLVERRGEERGMVVALPELSPSLEHSWGPGLPPTKACSLWWDGPLPPPLFTYPPLPIPLWKDLLSPPSRAS